MAIQILILGGRLGWYSTCARHPACDAAADVAQVVAFGGIVVLVIDGCVLFSYLAIPVPIEVLLGEWPAGLCRAQRTVLIELLVWVGLVIIRSLLA